MWQMWNTILTCAQRLSCRHVEIFTLTCEHVNIAQFSLWHVNTRTDFHSDMWTREQIFTLTCEHANILNRVWPTRLRAGLLTHPVTNKMWDMWQRKMANDCHYTGNAKLKLDKYQVTDDHNHNGVPRTDGTNFWGNTSWSTSGDLLFMTPRRKKKLEKFLFMR